MERKIIPIPIRRTMRKSCVLLILALFSVSLNAQITVAVKNQPLKEILKVIETKSEYRFFYNEGLKGLDKITSLELNNATINQAMTMLLSNTGIGFKVEKKNLIVLVSETKDNENAQRNVTGTVIDQNGEPIIGASILDRNTKIGTITDVNGNFTLKVSDQSTLLISYIGYSSLEVKVGSQSKIKIQLKEDAKKLDEVVVVGYGTQKKSVVTGAISSVNSKDLQDQVTPRLEDALKGRTSGVQVATSSGQPGASSTVSIRGITSMNQYAPLYVVDGVPVGSLDYLDQADIASIEVLKDAASAAIYGTKGAAGVVLVTTKKGEAGVFKVNVNAYYGTQAPANTLSLCNATQYATLRNESLTAAGLAPAFSNPASLGTGSDWQSAIFDNNAKIQNYQVSMSGGSEKSTFYTSLGYFSQGGIVAPSISNFSRITVRFNSNTKMKKWLTFGNNLTYSHIKGSSIGENTYYDDILTSAIHLDPTTPIVVTDPAVLTQTAYANNWNYLVRDPNGNPYGISTVMTNPLARMAIQQGNYNWADKIVGNFFLEIEPVKNLKIRSSIGGELSFWGNESFTPTYFLNASTLNEGSNSFTRTNNRALIYTWTNTMNYSHSFGLHNFSGLLGTEATRNSDTKGTGLTYRGIPATNFKTASMNYSIPTAQIVGSGYENQPYTLASVFGRLTYDYDGKYMFTGIIRRDGSSHFGSDNVYGYFPSASVGWLISKEGFWKENNIVDMLKVRAGYGVNGNDNLGNFQYTSLIVPSGGYIYGKDNLTTGYAPQTIANPNLQWEKTSQVNIGVDAVLLRNLTATIEVYNKTTTGMLMQPIIPAYVGVTSRPWANVASMHNNGIELDLGYHFNVSGLRVDLKGNASYVENKVTNIGATEFIGVANMTASSYEVSRIVVGQPVDVFYGFQTDGIFQTQADINSYKNKSGALIQPKAVPGDFKWKDINSDGVIDSKDRTYLGNPNPNFTYGFTINLAYKDFDLSVFGQGVSGNKIFQELRRLDIPTGNYQTSALARWTGPGTSNTYPRLTDNDTNGNFTNPSNFYLQDGAYFRIKNLQIGYNIPTKTLKAIQLDKARIYVAGTNLFTLTKYTGYDPEIGGSAGTFGVDRGVYPQARSFMLGLDVTF